MRRLHSSMATWRKILMPITRISLNDLRTAASTIPFHLKRRTGSPPRALLQSLLVSQEHLNGKNLPFSLSAGCQNKFYCSRTTAFWDVKFEGHIVYSKTVEEAERAADELLNFVEAKNREEGQCILGLDIEWKPSFVKGVSPGKAAVMQICGDNHRCFVFHIHSQISKSLQRLLQDTACQKVGIGIAADATKVLQDHNVSIKNLRDLSTIANQKLGGEHKQRSLSTLVETLLGRKIVKPNKIRLGNWEARVLSKEQLTYAATDAYICWHLYQVLNALPDPR